MKSIKLGNKCIGQGNPVFIIAEAGVNHNQRLDLAFKLVDAAIEAGADAVKFQTFKTEKLQLKGIKKPGYQDRNVGNVDYFKLIKGLEMSFVDQKKIADYCKEKGIMFLSTAYEEESADFLDSLGVPAHKMASIELTNHLFLRDIAKRGKPVFVSTGLADIDKVADAVRIFKEEGMKDNLMLFQCTSNYPTLYKDINLRVIPDYIKRFDVICGLSDHSPDDIASVGAVALGGLILEKHFTLDKTLPGPDHSSSLEPDELRQWVEHVRDVESFMAENPSLKGEDLLKAYVDSVDHIRWEDMEVCLGSAEKKLTAGEEGNAQMKKYIVIRPAKAGTEVTRELLTGMRTGGVGVEPLDRNIDRILGKRLKKDVFELKTFSWDMIE